ncbi:MAG TPA: prolyl oligopeptidase family serine peptidase [Vicinamibacterales bacterium]|nr:prolyl oligopeptidase family serine peptidase [Vicinamibacterales bacterium]
MRRLCFCAVLLLALGAIGTADEPRGSITIDRIAAIKYPTSPEWSPDGARVAFLWDAAGKQDVFVVTPGQAPVALTDFPVDQDLLQSDIGALAWASPDEILFARNGQLWSVAHTRPDPAPMAGLREASSFALSPDRQRIAFLREGQIWIASLATKSARQLTRLAAPVTASVPVFARDGKWLTFTAGHVALQAEDLPWNGNLIRSFERTTTTERRLGFVSVYGGDPAWIPTVGSVSAMQWTADGSVLYQEASPDGKTREIKVASRGQLPRTIWRDHDERWWSPTRRDSKVLVSPDGETVAFISDRPGWMHLFAMPVDAASENEARQLTTGEFAVGLNQWSPDGRRIAYHHGLPGNPMEKAISAVDVASGAITSIIRSRGVNLDAMYSPDGSRILYQHTDVENSLDLYVAPATAHAKSIRLSDSMPPGLDKADLTVPEPVSFPSRLDGAPVPATLMVSKTLDRAQKHAALVWIHGSGSDQNFLGWHPGSYRMYYSLCQYLAQQGYVILTPDYRGSSGYSRDWATGVHMNLGVADTADVASGADYLKTLSYVDPDRIGVFGLSYGGFLTLQALNSDPTLWRAGVNVAGVVDWATYGAGYTTPRLGTPVENPEIYEVSAPIHHMDRLERPLLVLHGTNDRNVAFRDSLRVIDVLLKLGKDFEMGVYPGEAHFFRREHILHDAWRRIEDFFNRTVRDGKKMVSR